MSPSSTNLSTATNCNESPPLNLPYLPDDLLLNCFARVSRLYYPTLSLVSKRFRSLLASLELYETRTLLSRTESCLYVHLQFGSGEARWFTLCRRPTRVPNPNPNPNPNPKSQWFTPCFRPFRTILNRTRKKERKSSDNLLVSVSTRSFSPYCQQNLTSFGSNIYMINGVYDNGEPSSRVFFMDCRSHTRHEAPSMRIAREFPQVSVLDGKIYVVEEGRGECDSSSLIEVFDPITKIWEHVPNPGAEIRGTCLYKSLAMNDNLYLLGDKHVVYKPKENRWDSVGWEMYGAGMYDASCEIDNVMFCNRPDYKVLEWYDSLKRSWQVLKGLKELSKLPTGYGCVRLVNYGGKIAVLWEKDVVTTISFKKMIWCAVIALERRNKHELYGKVEWCDVVLTVPELCYLENFVAVTV